MENKTLPAPLNQVVGPFGNILLDDGRIQCRVVIKGFYNGKPFTYTDPEGQDGTQFIWPDGDPSEFWWSEGNMSCGCNRGRFAGVAGANCHTEVYINTITPLDPALPSLVLDEWPNPTDHRPPCGPVNQVVGQTESRETK